MTQNRTYRKTVSKDIALKEIDRFAGTQFDPNIVAIFIKNVLTDKSFGGV